MKLKITNTFNVNLYVVDDAELHFGAECIAADSEQAAILFYLQRHDDEEMLTEDVDKKTYKTLVVKKLSSKEMNNKTVYTDGECYGRKVSPMSILIKELKNQRKLPFIVWSRD